MSMAVISLTFDIVVMGLLATTIFYAVRLSRHLDSFRSNRADMEQLIRELSSQITRAQEGITVLDDLASTKGDELRKYIARAQALSDELQIITGSADSLAGRLEQLATRNRTLVDNMEQTAVDLVYPGQARTQDMSSEAKAARVARYEDTLSKADKSRVEKISGPSFTIRDPDFDEDDEIAPIADEDDDGFLSQAERDLAEALKRRGQKK